MVLFPLNNRNFASQNKCPIHSTMNNKNYTGHLCMLIASIAWGLMSPIGKDIMGTEVTALSLATFRMVGGAVCFWIASLFTKHEEVKPHDLMMLFFAALFAIVFNQGLFIFGLSLTSPINASIITTMAPIATMILAAIYLREPVTGKKVGGVFLGAIGALILIIGSSGHGGKDSSIWGDVLCFIAQVSFAAYLTFFKDLVTKYSPITCMKWMFTYASMCFIPFLYRQVSSLPFSEISTGTWGEIAFVVIGATFMTFLLLMVAQKILRPTVLSMYNYTQPIIASIVSVIIGLGTFGWLKGLAVVLVFAGVYLVTQSKSRAQMLQEKEKSPDTIKK